MPMGERTGRRDKRKSAEARAVSKDERIVGATRVEAVMLAAERSGLLAQKRGRIGGRVSLALLKQAKRQTGIEADTELIEFALANVALEDKFAEAFKESRGKVDPDIKIGF